MKLYIGGKAQGKTEYVLKLYPDSYICDERDYDEVFKNYMTQGLNITDSGKIVIWNHFHLCIKKMIDENCANDYICDYVNQITEKIPNLIIVSDEVGNGIVPIEERMRDYREMVGRLLINIANNSESVERIICQIPMKLK